MKLWNVWFGCTSKLQTSCSHYRTFFWMLTILAAFSIRNDLAGVSSFIRCLGIQPIFYYSLLHFFHSSAINLPLLSHLWLTECLSIFSGFLVKQNDKIVILADGIKIAKQGKKMPAVKKLYQESADNRKPRYIMGQYIESLALLVGNGFQFFAVPLVARIHDGVLFTKDDEDKTIIDRFLELVVSFLDGFSFYIVADAYYNAKKVLIGLINTGNHMITRMRSNAIAWKPYRGKRKPKSKGRPRKYGKKVLLRKLFDNLQEFKSMRSPVYGEKKVSVQYLVCDLLLRPFAIEVRIVLVVHPKRGRIILLTTDRALSAREIICIYGKRFKIEVSFKQAIYTVGTYAYHFWMKAMEKISWNNNNPQKVYLKDERYQQMVKRKIRAYTLFIQLGLIAQGMMQYLSLKYSSEVWKEFCSWMRTMDTKKCPSEYIVSQSLRSTFFAFLFNWAKKGIWKKFLIERTDFIRISEPSPYILHEI